MSNENGSTTYLEEVKEKGYTGFAACYIRSITPPEKFKTCYEAILRFTERMGFDSVDSTPGWGYRFQIVQALRKLPVRWRNAIDLYYGIEGRPANDIQRVAAELGCTAAEVGEFIGLGMKMLGEDNNFEVLIVKPIIEACKREST